MFMLWDSTALNKGLFSSILACALVMPYGRGTQRVRDDT